MNINDLKPLSDEELGIVPDREDEEEDQEVEKDQEEDQETDSSKDESEDESEEEAEQESEEDEEEVDEKPKSKSRGIPLRRFQEVNEKMHRLQAELELVKSQQQLQGMQKVADVKEEKAPEYDFASKEREYAKLVGNMQEDEATKLRDEINTEMAKKYEKVVEVKMAQMAEEMEKKQYLIKAQAEMDLIAGNLFKEHPFIDHNSKHANREAIDKIVKMRNYFIAVDKLSPGQALQEAAKMVIPQYVSVDAPTLSKSEREEKAKKIAVETSNKIPPSTGKAGVGSKAEKTEGSYTQKQWEKLTENERNRILGIE